MAQHTAPMRLLERARRPPRTDGEQLAGEDDAPGAGHGVIFGKPRLDGFQRHGDPLETYECVVDRYEASIEPDEAIRAVSARTRT